MRITGGTYKGRKLIVPPGVIRPAMDRMRESLFAVLGDIRDCSFLDLYCGSGAVGIEAASRGADPVVFVEKDRGKRSALQRNLAFVRERTAQRLMPVEHYLRRVKSGFDLIFLDPPFRQMGTLEVLRLISARRVLAEGGTLIIHLPKEEESNFPQVISLDDTAESEVSPASGGRLRLSDRRLYGGSVLLFYR
jgi:16S rRNA (guanine(966)-N(2))-methyltransferase RsmD